MAILPEVNCNKRRIRFRSETRETGCRAEAAGTEAPGRNRPRGEGSAESGGKAEEQQSKTGPQPHTGTTKATATRLGIQLLPFDLRHPSRPSRSYRRSFDASALTDSESEHEDKRRPPEDAAARRGSRLGPRTRPPTGKVGSRRYRRNLVWPGAAREDPKRFYAPFRASAH